MIDSEILEKNLAAYISSHGEALNVLKKANGQRNYKDIARELTLHPTTVSSLLKKAEKLGLAKNISGFYKKVSGILGFIKPKTSQKKQKVSSSNKSFKTKIQKAKSSLEIEAWKNAELYPHIYILENKLRELILKVLGNNISWWKTPQVPQKIITYAEDIKRDEQDTPWINPRGDHPIYYITLNHLFRILTAHWHQFKKLGNQQELSLRFKDLYPLRNALAHNIPLSGRDKKEIEISVDKICKTIEAKYNI